MNGETGDFRDFVLSRMQSADWPEEDAPLPGPDTAWETWETLSLVPNPALSAEHQAAVQEDFGLKSGKLVLKVRQAMPTKAEAAVRPVVFFRKSRRVEIVGVLIPARRLLSLSNGQEYLHT